MCERKRATVGVGAKPHPECMWRKGVKKREAIRGGGKKLKQKQGSGEKRNSQLAESQQVCFLSGAPSSHTPHPRYGVGGRANAVRALKSRVLLWQPPGTLCLQGNRNVTA